MEGYDVPMSNFTNSWRDGTAFNVIIHRNKYVLSKSAVFRNLQFSVFRDFFENPRFLEWLIFQNPRVVENSVFQNLGFFKNSCFFYKMVI